MLKWLKPFIQLSTAQAKKGVARAREKLVAQKLVKPKAGEKNTSRQISVMKKQPSESAELTTASGQHYFIEARCWADDMHTSAILSRNRYKVAFYITMGLALLLAIAINGLVPAQRLVPLLVNHYQDGRVSVAPIKQPYAPSSQAQVESELVRYLINRESYDTSSYNEQYALINLLSTHDVAKEYITVQAAGNAASPIHRLGNHGYRTVHVESVVFLDAEKLNKHQLKKQQTHHNLAQINFTVTDHYRNAGRTKTIPLTALVSIGTTLSA